MSEIQLTEQLELSSCLRIIPHLDRKLVRLPSLDIPFSERNSLKDFDKALISLNWVSLFLTSSDTDSYATCISHDGSFPLLLIANSEWSATPTDVEKARAGCLLEMIDVLARGKGKNWNSKEKIGFGYENLIVHRWPLIWARIHSAQSVISEANKGDHLLTLLDSWLTYQSKQDPASFTAENNAKAKKTIRELLNELLIIEEPQTSQPHEELKKLRMAALTNAVHACVNLNTFGFFRCFKDPADTWAPSLNAKDMRSMRWVLFEMHKLVEYGESTAIFVSSGVRYFRAYISDKPASKHITELIKIEWVNSKMVLAKPKAAEVFSQTPIDFITSERAKVRNKVQMKEKGQEVELTKKCANLWKIGDSATAGGRIYADVRMVLYLSYHNIEVLEMALGLNEPPCTSSYHFIAGESVLFRTSSPFVRTDWLAPLGAHEEANEPWAIMSMGRVFKNAREEMRNVVDAFLVDHKAENLSDNKYQDKLRYSAKEKPYIADFYNEKEWEAKFCK